MLALPLVPNHRNRMSCTSMENPRRLGLDSGSLLGRKLARRARVRIRTWACDKPGWCEWSEPDRSLNSPRISKMTLGRNTRKERKRILVESCGEGDTILCRDYLLCNDETHDLSSRVCLSFGVLHTYILSGTSETGVTGWPWQGGSLR